jgi:ribosomal protein S18
VVISICCRQNKAKAAGSIFAPQTHGMGAPLGSTAVESEKIGMMKDAIQAAAAEGPALLGEGLAVDYCIFCYHGTNGILSHDNMALLTMFVSERGLILPKRFTKCCAKHQRK